MTRTVKKITVSVLMSVLFVLLAVGLLLGFTGVRANGETVEVDGTAQTINGAIEGATDEVTVKLTANVTESVTITEGKTVTLDLNGCTLTNADTHTVTNYGTLTVIDSSENQTGTVTNVTDNKATIYNEYGATATLESGKYTRENISGNTYYLIENLGTMTINGGDFSSFDVSSSMIRNYGYNSNSETHDSDAAASLTITAGSFSGGLNTVKNDDNAKLLITGGTFTDTEQCTVMNWSECEITGGTFSVSSSGNYSTTYVVYNTSYTGGTSQGSLKITGGVFSGATIAVGTMPYNVNMPTPTVEISGGTFTCSTAGVYAYGSSVSISGGEYSGGAFAVFALSYVETVSEVEITKASEVEITNGTFNGTTRSVYAKDSSTTIAISGGEFYVEDTENETYIADGSVKTYVDTEYAEFDEETNTVVSYTVFLVGADDTKQGYATLAAAVAAAAENDVITLISDVTVSDTYIKIDKTLTLDIDSYTVTLTSDLTHGFWIESGGNLTIVGSGSIESYYDPFYMMGGTLNLGKADGSSTFTVTCTKGDALAWVYNDAVLNLYKNVTLKTPHDVTWVIDLDQSNPAEGQTVCATANIWGVIEGGRAGVTINGKVGNEKCAINVYDGAEISAATSTAIYNANGSTTISGGTITGADTAVEIRAGSLTVTGGTLTSTATELATRSSGGGTTVSGAAIAISQHTTNLPITVEVSNSVISGYYAVYEKDLQDDTTEGVTISLTSGTYTGIVSSENVTGFISGGEFNTNVSAYAADGYAVYGYTGSDGSVIYSAVKEDSDDAAAKTAVEVWINYTGSLGVYGAYADLKTAFAAAEEANYSFVTIVSNYIIASGETVTIPSGIFLAVAGDATLTVRGTLNVGDGESATSNSVLRLLKGTNEDDSGAILKIDGGEVLINSYAYEYTNSYYGTTTISIRSGYVSFPGWAAYSNTAAGGAATVEGTFTAADGKVLLVSALGEVYSMATADAENAAGGYVTPANKNMYGAGETYLVDKYSFPALTDGDKFTLTNDMTASLSSPVTADITIDLNGYTLTLSTRLNIEGKVTLTSSVTGGTLTSAYLTSNASENYAIYLTGTLTVGQNVAVTAAENVTVIFVSTNSVLNVSGAIKATGTASAIIGNGTVTATYTATSTYGNTTINIYDGAEITSAATAIYHPQDGTINIYGGVISGATGIEMRSGTLNMMGGEIKTTATSFTCTANGSGTTVSGAALAVSKHTTDLNLNVSVTGGKLTAENEAAYAFYEENVQQSTAGTTTLAISGGTFSGAVKAVDQTGFITGGTFTFLSEQDYFAEGYSATYNAETGAYVASDDPAVALINGTYGYKTLQLAIDAAQAGDTVTLLAATTISEQSYLKIATNITLDLGGNKLTFDGKCTFGFFVTGGATVTIKNGYVSSCRYAIYVGTVNDNADNVSVLTLDGVTVTTDNQTLSDALANINGYSKFVLKENSTLETTGAIALAVWDNASADVYGTAISAKSFAISTNGSSGQNATVNIYEGATVESTNSIAIYIPSGTFTISGGTITGATGIYMRSGSLTISKDSAVTVTATATEAGERDANTTGAAYNTGDAVIIDSSAYPSGVPQVKIAGGTYTSVAGNAVVSVTSKDITENVTGFISGGSFTSLPEQVYFAEEYSATYDEGTETYVASNDPAVALVNGTYGYKTLQLAIDAANDGDTIVLLADITEDVTVTAEQNTITFDLNGKTITGQFNVESGNVTLKNGTITRNGTGDTAKEQTTLCVTGGSVTVDDGLTVVAQASPAMAIAVQNAKMTIETVTICGNGVGIGIYDGAEVLIKYADIQVYSNAISSNVNVTNASVTIEGGIFKCLRSANDWLDSAIYWANHGTLTIKGGEFTSADAAGAALYAKNGTVIVEGGKFYGTKDGIKIDSTANNTTSIEVKISGGDFSGSRSGMYISTQYGTVTTEVTGGTFAVEGTSGEGALYTKIQNNNIPTLTIKNGEETTPVFNGELQTALVGFISGGNFNVLPEQKYFAEGYSATYNAETGAYVASNDPAVALVNGTYGYKTLQLAIDAAQAGDTVTLLCDLNSSSSIKINTAITLDLNEHKINATSNIGMYIYAGAKNVTVKNGTLILSGSEANKWGIASLATESTVIDGVTIEITNNNYTTYGIVSYATTGSMTITGCTVTINGGTVNSACGGYGIYSKSNVTVTNTTVTSDGYGIVLQGQYTTANLKSALESGSDITYVTLSLDGVTVSAYAFALSGNGSYHGTVFTVKDSKLKSTGAPAIYHPQYGTLTLSGETEITGISGIEMRAGSLSVEEGSTVIVTATGTFNAQANGNGATVSGAAIAISQHTTDLPITVFNLASGTYIGEYAIYEADLQNTSTEDVTVSVSGGTYVGQISSEDLTGFITGGSFATLPEQVYFAEGYSATYDEGTETYVASDDPAVALVNGTYGYKTLQLAIDAAESGDTVTLLAATTLDANLEIKTSITLDLGGYTLTFSENNARGICVTDGATVTVQNGKVEGYRTALYVGEYTDPSSTVSTLTLDNVTVTETATGETTNALVYINGYSKFVLNADSALEANNCAALTVWDYATADVYGTVKSADNYAIATNGSDSVNVTVNIYEGATIESTNAVAIYNPRGNFTISGGTITGKDSAVEIRAGSLTISGGTFTSTATEFAAAANGNGSTVSGAAIAISQHTTDLSIKVNISGGTFEGIYAVYEEDLQDNTTEGVTISLTGGTYTGIVSSENVTGFITGGSFTVLPSYEYFADEYSARYDSSTNTYVTENVAWVAAIGTVGYQTLQAAIDAAQAGDTVTLVGNLTESVTITEGKTVTLDLNGYTLTNVNTHTITNYGTLTVIDSSENQTGVVDNVTHGKAAVINYGTAYLYGGTYTRSQEAGTTKSANGNSWYTLKNYGYMVIGEDETSTVKVTTRLTDDSGNAVGGYSSLIANGYQNATDWKQYAYVTTEDKIPTLVINGGEFEGGINTLKNDDYSVATVNGGTFKNVTQAAVLNWNYLTVNGGTFEVDGNLCSVITGADPTNGDYNNGTTAINGGTFTGAIAYFGGYGTYAEYTITGGTFTNGGSLVSSENLDDEYVIYYTDSSDVVTVSSIKVVPSGAKLIGGRSASDFAGFTIDEGYTSVFENGAYIIVSYADYLADAIEELNAYANGLLGGYFYSEEGEAAIKTIVTDATAALEAVTENDFATVLKTLNKAKYDLDAVLKEYEETTLPALIKDYIQQLTDYAAKHTDTDSEGNETTLIKVVVPTATYAAIYGASTADEAEFLYNNAIEEVDAIRAYSARLDSLTGNGKEVLEAIQTLSDSLSNTDQTGSLDKLAADLTKALEAVGSTTTTDDGVTTSTGLYEAINTLESNIKAAISTLESTISESLENLSDKTVTLEEIQNLLGVTGETDTDGNVNSVAALIEAAQNEIESLKTDLGISTDGTLTGDIKNLLGLTEDVASVSDMISNAETAITDYISEYVIGTNGQTLAALETQISNLSTTVETDYTALSNSIEEANSALAALKTAVGEAADGETDASGLYAKLEDLDTSISNAVDTLKSYLDSAVSTLEGNLLTLDQLNEVLGITEEDGSTIAARIADLKTALESIATEDELKTMLGLTEETDSVATLISAAQKNITDYIDEHVIGEYTTTLSNISSAIDTLSGTVNNDYTALSNSIEEANSALAALKTAVGEAADGETDASGLYAKLEDLDTSISNAVDTLKSYLDSAVSTLEGNLLTLDQLNEVLGITADDNSTIAERIADLKTALGSIATEDELKTMLGLTEETDSVATLISAAQKNITDYIDEHVIGEYTTTLSNISSAIDTLSGTVNNDYTALSNSITAAQTAIAAVQSSIGSLGTDETLVTKIGEAIAATNNAKAELSTAITNAISETNDKVDAIKADIDTYGSKINDVYDLLVNLGTAQSNLSDALEDLGDSLNGEGGEGGNIEKILTKIADAQTTLDSIGSAVGATVTVEKNKEEAKAELDSWLNSYIDKLLAPAGSEASVNGGAVSLAIVVYADSQSDLEDKLNSAFSKENAALVLKYYNEAVASIENATTTEEISNAVSTFKTQVAMVEVIEGVKTPDNTGVIVLLVILVVLLIVLVVLLALVLLKKKGGHDGAENSAEEKPAPVEETPAEPVEETSVEETSVEEAPVEETSVEETPVEETPAEPAGETEVAVAVEAEAEADEEWLERYDVSFLGRLNQADPVLQIGCGILTDLLTSYKGVKARDSWKQRRFGKGRTAIAYLLFKGKRLCLALALDPKQFEGTKYRVADVSAVRRFKSTPTLIKLTSQRKLKYAKELVELLMTKYGAEKSEGKGPEDDVTKYLEHRETMEKLIAKGLAKTYSVNSSATAFFDSRREAPAEGAETNPEE